MYTYKTKPNGLLVFQSDKKISDEELTQMESEIIAESAKFKKGISKDKLTKAVKK